MRWFVLSVAALFFITLNASAVERNDAGRGQVLLFPFFTTLNGWDTYINVALESDSLGVPRSGIVRLRVLDGESGEAVRTFNAYLESGENLRVALTETAPGESVLRVAEGGCLLADDGEFGGVGNDFSLPSQVGMLEAYRLSANGGVIGREDCESLADRWAPGGAWTSDPMDELNESSYSAEVRGQFVLVNVAQGLSAEQPAIGLAQFAESIPHTAPDDASPTLEDAEPVAIFGPGTSFVPDSGEGIDAIALLLSTYRGSITNDIVADTTVGARTDWIVSFPLQGYRDYGENITTVNGEQRSCSPNVLGGDDPAFRFFLSGPWLVWGGGFVTGWTTIDFAPIPFVPWEPFLCYPVNTLTFGDGAPIFLDAENVLQSPPALGDGTLSLGSSTATVRYQFPDGFSEPGKNDGRPVVAYRVTTFINGTLANGSTLANYMFMRPHTVE